MVLADIDVKAIKTGMLFDAENTRAVVRSLKNHYSTKTKPPIICDPVCVSTSGHTLLHPDALKVLTPELFPLTTLITPNKSEAELLLSQQRSPVTINTVEDMISAAARLILVFASGAVLIKGGHITTTAGEIKALEESHPSIHIIRQGLLGENMEILLTGMRARSDVTANPSLVVDVLQDRRGETVLFVRPRLESASTHETGRTLSAAIACSLPHGDSCMIFTHTFPAAWITFNLQ
jgi:hydroxymethylpyrimidine/phosphomethylpyrimidine kinase